MIQVPRLLLDEALARTAGRLRIDLPLFIEDSEAVHHGHGEVQDPKLHLGLQFFVDVQSRGSRHGR